MTGVAGCWQTSGFDVSVFGLPSFTELAFMICILFSRHIFLQCKAFRPEYSNEFEK